MILKKIFLKYLISVMKELKITHCQCFGTGPFLASLRADKIKVSRES